MRKKETEEFRVREYLHDFEKSLNYMAGAILTILVTGVCLIASKPEWNITILSEMFHNIHDNPTELLGVLSAILCTLPYYFYYTLKDDIRWIAYRGDGDNFGLWKIFIWYEICILSFCYLLFQGDVSYSVLKLMLASINTLLAAIYLGLLIKGKKDGEHIGYFISIIIMLIVFFALLAVNSLLKLISNIGNQNTKMWLLFLLFAVNSGINFLFLIRADVGAETGIISNRKKIMIPIISISVFTFSMVYCFFYFDSQWWTMLAVAIWITLYEILISALKRQDKVKKIFCIGSFIVFVAGIPVLILRQKENLPSELAINWLILIGISIYLAAIKYWGYILKLLFGTNNIQGSRAKQMNIVVWYRNSILGSMLFLLIILLLSGRYCAFMLTVLVCSFISEWFIYKHVLSENWTGDKNKAYLQGRYIEFASIILPIIVFVVENLLDWKLWEQLKFSVELPQRAEEFVAIAGVALVLGRIAYKWKDEKTGWIESILNLFKKESFENLLDGIKKIFPIRKQALSDRNAENFWTTLTLWAVYFGLTAYFLYIIMECSAYRIVGIVLMLFIVIADWFFLTKRLLDYYMERMKEGKRIVEFENIFEPIWKECLAVLDEFNVKDVMQFNVGDRIRPILFFWGSSYGWYNSLNDEDYVNIAKAACSLELIHKSSVIFDDYIDKDEMRKGVPAFHKQYEDVNLLILVGNMMLAIAQTNFVECKNYFKCDDVDMIDNMKILSQIVKDLCKGCYKELSLRDIEMQSIDEIKNIINLETVSLIKGSIGLGYRCFHDKENNSMAETIEALGEAFGYVFQYLNDLEPFSQKSLYVEHKGNTSNCDYGKKNIAMLTLYKKLVSEDEKDIFKRYNYDTTLQLYQKYKIEDEILNEVREKINKIEKILEKLEPGNSAWVNGFKTLYNQAIRVKRWEGKVPLLGD